MPTEVNATMDRNANDQGSTSALPVCSFGAVAIGRNEGQRLIACLQSLSDASASAIIYVDSASTDGSARSAQDRGVEVVELDLSIPFTAARARNAGFACLLEIAPERSVYNWLCDREWDGPAGEVRACAGNVMMRVQALENVGGYREDVIAAEEDELCVRLRQAKWRIWRIPNEMALHDAAMLYFRQWWKRSVRAGYAFAQGAHLHGATPERHFVWESRRAWIWGLLLPLFCILVGVAFHPFGWIACLIYPLQLIRLTARGSDPLRDRARLALFQVLARFPEGLGQMMFQCDRLLRRRPQLIEHK
jgi:glycosyltransferase involved in cell wall biosynthesis